MPIITPDMSEVSSDLVTGTRKAKVVSVEAGTSTAGNPKLVVKFDVDVDGRSVPRTAHIPTSGKGAFNFDRFLRAAGFAGYADELKAAAKNGTPASGFDTDSLIGQELQLVFGQQIYNNEPRDQIDNYLPA